MTYLQVFQKIIFGSRLPYKKLKVSEAQSNGFIFLEIVA